MDEVRELLEEAKKLGRMIQDWGKRLEVLEEEYGKRRKLHLLDYERLKDGTLHHLHDKYVESRKSFDEYMSGNGCRNVRRIGEIARRASECWRAWEDLRIKVEGLQMHRQGIKDCKKRLEELDREKKAWRQVGTGLEEAVKAIVSRLESFQEHLDEIKGKERT